MVTTGIPSSAVTPPVTNTTIGSTTQSFHAYLKERRTEISDLQSALKSGDLAAAQKDYNNLVALGQQDLGRNNPFLRSDRGLDFNAIGGALQSGDLNGARQAFAALETTYATQDPPKGTSSISPDTVVNLSNSGG